METIILLKEKWIANYYEITFLNKKYIQDEKIEYTKHFPIDGLDYPCNKI